MAVVLLSEESVHEGFDQTPPKHQDGLEQKAGKRVRASGQQDVGPVLAFEGVDERVEGERVAQCDEEGEHAVNGVGFVEHVLVAVGQELQASAVGVPVDVELDARHRECPPLGLVSEDAVHELEEGAFVPDEIEREMAQLESEVVQQYNEELAFQH